MATRMKNRKRQMRTSCKVQDVQLRPSPPTPLLASGAKGDGPPLTTHHSPLTILYEDNHCLALFKTAGVLTAGDKTGDVSLLDLARQYIREKYHKPGNVYLGVVHRLDRPVSGVVLFARTSKAAARLSEQFRSGTVTKVYHALVEGCPKQTTGEWIDVLVKDRERNVVRTVPEGAAGARQAVLEYRVLRRTATRSLLEIRPRTGRAHQIRVQLAARGLPIVGDVKYGARRRPARISQRATLARHASESATRPEHSLARRASVNSLPETPLGGGEKLGPACRIALHAAELTFEHPVRREPVTIRAPRPSDWIALFAR